MKHETVMFYNLTKKSARKEKKNQQIYSRINLIFETFEHFVARKRACANLLNLAEASNKRNISQMKSDSLRFNRKNNMVWSSNDPGNLCEVKLS